MKSFTSPDWRYAFFLFFIAIVVYLPGLPGGFVYDDYFNILQNPAIDNSELSLSAAWSASLSGKSGPLGRPLAMLSFYLNYHITGFSAPGFKVVNILIHAFNAIIVFFLAMKLLNLISNRSSSTSEYVNIRYIALAIAMIWAIHPINLTAVLYIVQRMTSLAAMFTLLGMVSYISLRENQQNNTSAFIARLILIALYGVLSGLSKENGLLLFLYLFVIECFFFKWRTNNSTEKWCLNTFYIVVLLLPLFVASFLLISGELTSNYSGRSFSLSERCLTQFRVIWFYISQILLPQADLFGLYHDDFVLSRSLVEPVTTLLSIVSLFTVFIISILYKNKFPWFCFGLTFFLIGHIMESTILPLNLVHEHRNYLPSIGLIIILVHIINQLVSSTKEIRKELAYIIVICIFSSITIVRAYDWSNNVSLGKRLTLYHPDSVTSNYEMGFTYTNIYLQTLNPVFITAAKLYLSKADSLAVDTMQPAIALLHLKAMTNENDDDFINEVSDKLKNRNITKVDVIELRQLVNCQLESRCNLKVTAIEKVFSSILENKKVKGRLNGDLNYIYSSYLETIPDKVDNAIAIMQKTIVRHPDIIEYQVKLISMLLNNGKNEEADILIKKLNERSGIRIQAIEKKLL